MNKIIKSYTYNVVCAEPFEMPFPCEFDLLYANTLLAKYNISEDGIVNYSYNPSANVKFPVTTKRPLVLDDIYFLLSSRVPAEFTPQSQFEMSVFEIEEYNQFEIIKKTHGVTAYDKYWIRFPYEEELTYKQMLKHYNDCYKKYYEETAKKFEELQREIAEKAKAEAIAKAELEKISEPAAKTVKDVLSQHEMNLEKVAEIAVGEPMTAEEFHKNVIGDRSDTEPTQSSAGGTNKKSVEDEIVSDLSSGETKMSDEAIAAMLASMGGGAETKTEEKPADPNAKMDDDAIAKMFAAMGNG
jgi:hypothetical protein